MNQREGNVAAWTAGRVGAGHEMPMCEQDVTNTKTDQRHPSVSELRLSTVGLIRASLLPAVWLVSQRACQDTDSSGDLRKRSWNYLNRVVDRVGNVCREI